MFWLILKPKLSFEVRYSIQLILQEMQRHAAHAVANSQTLTKCSASTPEPETQIGEKWKWKENWETSCSCTEANRRWQNVLAQRSPGWQGLAGFRGPQQNPSELSESAYLHFRDKNVVFIIAGKQAICGCQKTYTHTGRSLKHPFWCFDMYFGFVLLVRKLSKSGLSKSSTKAGWLLLEALQEQADLADFRWKHSQSRMTFVESSMVAIHKARKSRQY